MAKNITNRQDIFYLLIKGRIQCVMVIVKGDIKVIYLNNVLCEIRHEL